MTGFDLETAEAKFYGFLMCQVLVVLESWLRPQAAPKIKSYSG